MRPAALALVVAVAACGGRAARPAAPLANQPVAAGPAARPELSLRGALAMMPADSDVVIELDVAQLRGTVLWSMVEPWLRAQGGDRLARLVALCGVDFLSALDTLLLAARTDDAGHLTLFVRGLSRPAVLTCLERAAADDHRDVGVVVDGDTVEMVEGEAVTSRMRFVDDRTVLLVRSDGAPATRDQLAAAAAARPGDGLTSSPTFLALLGRVDTGATAWMIANGDQAAFATLPVKVRAVRVEVRAGTEPARALDLELVFELPDRQAASSLAALARTGLDQLRQQAPVAALVRGLAVVARDADVVITVGFDRAQLEQLADLLRPLVSP